MNAFEPSGHLARSIEQFGAHGERWLVALPSELARLGDAWGLQISEPYRMATCSFTATATRRDGTMVVLKVPIPHEEAAHEADALAAWDGIVSVRLLELDGSGAMLLERCEPGTPLAENADEDAASIGGGLLGALHRVAPDDHPFDLLADVLQRWADLARARVRALGESSDTPLIDEGAELLESLPKEDVPSVLLHGDYHHWNVLSATREPWLVIDPKPMVGDPMFDSAQFLGNRYMVGAAPDVFRNECERFADAAGFELQRMLTWCFAREVDSAMWRLSVGEPDGAGVSIEYARVLRELARVG